VQQRSRIPQVIFDGDCSFCRAAVAYSRALTGESVWYAPFQKEAANFPEITLDRFQQAVHLVEPDGRISRGAEAVFRTLAYVPGYGWLLWLYLHVPGFAPASEFAYRYVANHRPFFDRVRIVFWGRGYDPPSHFLTRWLFLRLLAIVYLAAFASLWPQIPGLIGSQGILSASHFLAVVARLMGPARYHVFPTLAWLNSSGTFLEFLAGAGVVCSILLFLGLASGPALVVLWVLYLSLTTVGQDFLSFQWDVLLLEAGFLAMFLAPWRPLVLGWRTKPNLTNVHSPSKLVIWLLRWLLFRLMFLSGCVKLASGDVHWRNFTALEYHYETQPLPTPLGWYAYHLPTWFQRASTAGVFFFELIVPLLIFAPRRLRFAGGALLVGFQLLIASTGNYAFFNLLAITLCVTLLDDQAWRHLLPKAVSSRFLQSARPGAKRWFQWIPAAALALVILPVSVQMGVASLWGTEATPHWSAEIAAWLEPFHIVSSYGLFAVMTVSRPEIIIQGSNDGVDWSDYQFKFKPEALKRAPRWVAPYQPRLDWQMWFAALDGNRPPAWFVDLIGRLLQGSKPVLALLGRNPFPQGPPRYVRALLYDYSFTTFGKRHDSGEWWRRRLLGIYFPAVSLGRQ
jgi:lipase maturation factor 1